MSQDMQKYRDAIWGTGGEINTQETLVSSAATADKNTAAQNIIMMGKDLANLNGLLASASLDNKDADHRSWSLKVLIDSYGGDTKERKVKLPPDLVAQNGGNANTIKFGVQDIHSASDMERLQKDVALAKQYFADIQLHTITDAKGNQLALVVGVDAKDFNAVVSAENKKETLAKAIDEARQQLGVDLTPKKDIAPAQQNTQTVSTEPFSLNMENIQARFPKKDTQEASVTPLNPTTIAPMQTPAQESNRQREVA